MVLVEDHLYHIDRTLEVLARDAPELIDWLTVVCLDRPGPDSRRAVAGWLARHPALQVAVGGEVAGEPEGRAGAAAGAGAASAGRGRADDGGRWIRLDAAVFDQSAACCRAIASLLRPGGLLLQDVQLETLAFISRQRWWESIFLASAVRGTFGDRQPVCRFLSNKRGYAATFGRDLLDAGFDPRDVLDKDEVEKVLVPVLRDFLQRALPFTLEMVTPGTTRNGMGANHTVTRVGAGDRHEIEQALDLVLWCTGDTVELAGGAVERAAGGARVCIKRGSAEATTWRDLIIDRLGAHRGLPVVAVGERVAPAGALRPEVTNCAARHLHGMRGRLRDGAAVATVDHTYRLGDRLTVGLVT